MSHQGSGSAFLITLIVVMMAVITMFPLSDAATYTVGDGDGWSYNAVNWPQGKHFRAGDSLVFNYDPGFHNVVAVNGTTYGRCLDVSPDARVYRTGEDYIMLVKGHNFFICDIPSHCGNGMRIAIYAE